MKYYLSSCLLLFSLNLIQAQSVSPCGSEAHREFDFWAGEWDVYKTGTDTIVGYNHIKKMLNGCVLEESWTGSKGFQGKSFNTYNPLDSTWNQVWVDQSGARYFFSGKREGNTMELQGKNQTRRGMRLFNMSFTLDEKTGSVRQIWKASPDNGKTWNLLFDGTYKKHEGTNTK